MKEKKSIKEYIEENLVKMFIGRSESPVGYFCFSYPRIQGNYNYAWIIRS